MKKQKFTKEEQQKAINQIVELLNKYQLQIVTEHEIKIIGFQNKETKSDE